MAAPENAWWDEMRHEAQASPVEPQRAPSKAPVIGAAAAAAVLAAALGWWVTTSAPTTYEGRESARLQPVAAATPVVASEVDIEQVRRAREDFVATYAASGEAGLARFRDSCEASARSDGRILDFCLGFDLMADTLVAPDAMAQARRLALVEAVAPDEIAPLRRVEAVRDVLAGMGALPTVQSVQAVAPPPQAPTETPKLVAASARVAPPKPRAPAAAPPSRCAGLPTPADRLICANPGLKTQHDRMRAAYETALANGADRLAVDRAQAEWRNQRDAVRSRADLSSLYARRTAELQAIAEEARLTPPS